MIKKIFSLTALAMIVTSLFIPMQVTQAAATKMKNCSWEALQAGKSYDQVCFEKVKTSVYDLNCYGLPKPTPYTPDAELPCCCNVITEYSCTWKTKVYVAGGGTYAPTGQWVGGCDADETVGKDCDLTKQPSGTNVEAYCCCAKEEPPYKKADFTIPEFQVPIDSITLSQAECTGPDNSGQCKIPWIAQYIQGIYRYGLGIGGILAAIVLMAGGVIWLVSAGDASKISQAKDLIIGSITGMIILSTSYIILSQINPDLTSLRSISVQMIERITIDPIKNGSDSGLNTSDKCAEEGDLINIASLVGTKAQTPVLSTEGYAGLEKAVAEAEKQGVELYVTSAFRTATHQQNLWDAAVAKYGDETVAAKYVARPGSCGGHRSGNAIDVCIKGSASCGKMGSKSVANYSDSDVVKLQQIMQAAGWLRYCGEWWHFQYNDPPGSSCSP